MSFHCPRHAGHGSIQPITPPYPTSNRVLQRSDLTAEQTGSGTGPQPHQPPPPANERRKPLLRLQGIIVPSPTPHNSKACFIGTRTTKRLLNMTAVCAIEHGTRRLVVPNMAANHKSKAQPGQWTIGLAPSARMGPGWDRGSGSKHVDSAQDACLMSLCLERIGWWPVVARRHGRRRSLA